MRYSELLEANNPDWGKMRRTQKEFRDIAEYDIRPPVNTGPFETLAFANYDGDDSALRAYSKSDMKTTAAAILSEVRTVAADPYVSAKDHNTCTAMIAFFEIVAKQDKAIAAMQRAISFAMKSGVSQASVKRAIDEAIRAR